MARLYVISEIVLEAADVIYLNLKYMAGLRPSFLNKDITGDGSVNRASSSE